jgi:hypothetical protein
MSPVKWHLAHTTCSSRPICCPPAYRQFDPSFGYLFNFCDRVPSERKLPKDHFQELKR